jgi:uncharacterized protein YecT (DUF1311 family)
MRTLLLISAPFLAATLAAVSPARAASPDIEARYSKDFKACPGLSGSTLEIVGCIDGERAVQDKALNTTYQKVLGDLTAPQKTHLRDAQRAWIAYRDAWCGAQQDDEWGSISKIVAAQCVLDETIRRTIELEHYPPET